MDPQLPPPPDATSGETQVDDAERARMAQRIVEVGELSRFVLALRDAVRDQAGET
jgi:hypothetical protein